MRTRMFAVLLACSFVTGASQGQAMVKRLCEGFLPKNDMWIAPGIRTGISVAQFNRVLDRAQQIFARDFEKRGAILVINRHWSDGTVNAYADQKGKTWTLDMYGGLARHQAVTEDAFALVTCHEVSHHLGGAPKYSSDIQWASNEGQSDYAASLKCARRFFAVDDNEAIVAGMQVDAFARSQCERQHSDRKELLLCIRSAMAGLSLSALMQDLGGDPVASFTTPDPRQVAKTADDHPRAQCRLDTYFAGSLCEVPVSETLSEKDARKGTCYSTAPKLGIRPRCWFKP